MKTCVESARKDVITSGKQEGVKWYFSEPSRYLTRAACDIRLRAETVQELVKGTVFTNILDIGCGDGSISLPLLRPETRITLLDSSPEMLSRAISNCPTDLMTNIVVVGQDFITAKLRPKSYDLILCLGVLAHVDSPGDFIAKLTELLKPRGIAIIEFTDSCHFMARLASVCRRAFGVTKADVYPLNVLSSAEVAKVFYRNRLHLQTAFRYSWWSLPGTRKVFSQRTLYRIVRLVFGTSERNRNTWLGNEYICLLRSLD